MQKRKFKYVTKTYNMRTPEEIQKNRKINKIIAIVCALLLITACTILGQVNIKKVFDNGDTITTRYSDYMSFSPYSKKDTTFLYIYGNENDFIQSFGFGVIYPRGIDLKSCSLTIGFYEGSEIKIYPCAVNEPERFVGYCLDSFMVEKISSCGYTSICFDSKTKMMPVTWSVMQRTFVDFFVNYYK
jgi:hypothetical protein